MPFTPKLKSWWVKTQYKLYETPVFQVWVNRTRNPDEDIESDFYVIKTYDWVNVIPVTPNGEVILVEQYRHGLDAISLEIPGGVIDSNEGDPVTAAARELQEETGYCSEHWTDLGYVTANPALQNNTCYFYLAEQCRPNGNTDRDDLEEIAVHTMPVERFMQACRDGVVHHSLVLAALAKLQLLRPDLLTR